MTDESFILVRSAIQLNYRGPCLSIRPYQGESDVKHLSILLGVLSWGFWLHFFEGSVGLAPGLPASFQDQKAVLKSFAASCMGSVQGLVPLSRGGYVLFGGFL